ncbi:response regulator transcription factor [bacterium]|nr:response regulator transcription factor [bacterium]|tara:strand:+ start:143 stop:832 length:690 start_codon:yes stop_codon:yes gene_type:complete
MDKLIAIAEDEKDLAEILSINLNNEGYKTKIFSNGLDLLKFCELIIPDLIILDIMMPNLDGIETCKLLRKKSKLEDVPIIFITAKGAESDIVVGHEVGGNDYLVKPVSTQILLSKIRRFLNRSPNIIDQNLLKFNEIIINMDSYTTTVNQKKIQLTTTEFLLLEALLKNIGRVLSRDQLIKRKRIWGDDKVIYDRTIDVHVKNLREKLGSGGRYIKTVRGIGYKIESDD